MDKDKRSSIIQHIDNLLLWKDPEIFERRWQKRCDNCNAPCCFFGMSGSIIDYEKDTESIDVKEMQNYFQQDFVIINLKHKTWQEHVEEDGFNVQLDTPELNKLQICPLNIMGRCMIYDDRPKICREWKCTMAQDTYLGVK